MGSHRAHLLVTWEVVHADPDAKMYDGIALLQNGTMDDAEVSYALLDVIYCYATIDKTFDTQAVQRRM